MSRYILIRRLRGPAFLLLVGVNALLAEGHILGWGRSWPFYLILAGVFQLAERAALASEDYSVAPGPPWQGAPQGTNQGGPFQGAGQGATSSITNTGTAIVPMHHFENDREGGQQ
jgi:hypothetical protein